tara:strand:+ start:996 stop:1235 length:240 start_codon:yes stop_codon:yes gene_type:complete
LKSNPIFFSISELILIDFDLHVMISNIFIFASIPSRDIFNVSFVSEEAQDLKVKIVNVMGEELLTEDLQFVGEYVKSIT